MNNIIDLFKRSKANIQFEEHIKKKQYSIFAYNTSINVKYLLAYNTFLETKEPVIYVTTNLYKANLAYEGISKIAGYENVSFYAVDELISEDLLAVSNDLKTERINTIASIINNKPKIIITHLQALLKPLISKDIFSNYIINLSVGKEINRNKFIQNLIFNGYIKTPMTSSTGDFSVRGEVIDIFPVFSEKPIRINFFDEEIEKLRYFDSLTQISNNDIKDIDIYPLNELVYDNYIKEQAINNIKGIAQEKVLESIYEDIENHENDERINKFINYFYSDVCNILDYIEDFTIMYDEFSKINEVYEKLQIDINYLKEERKNVKNNKILYLLDINNIFNKHQKEIYLSDILQNLKGVKLDVLININSYLVIDYRNDIKNFINDIKANPSKTFILAFSDEKKVSLIKEVFLGEIKYQECDDYNDIVKQKVNIIKSDISLGYGMFDENYEVFTEKELFRDFKFKQTKYRSSYQNTISIESKEELEIGDYVVHYDHGIGKYKGIKTVQVHDVRNDYIWIEYSNMEIYIPVENISLLDKYQGSEGSIPKLTKLGTKEWDKRKKVISEKLEDIAKELIDTQVIREQNIGYVYPKDDEFQKLIEDEFPHDETSDQIKAIKDIKKDMEQGKIIDRLICGDVGYGKTEIALRAAVKTVLGQKQVAYLAPTTILSRQHYYTFKERLDKYGIRVELLNRLIPPKKQKEIINGLKSGLVDIIIGTHRILSEDIKFIDLGLLIVDEEQRFGVIHKEQIKKLKSVVNVLTLTATPIPRTLQMAITGIRQLSLISTPPKDRYPVQTYVVEENDIVIKEAIYRELSRGGQVFYLHNKVVDLERIYRKIQRLVPEAKIIIAHGQMNKEQLEDSITKFVDGEYNVLLCTTIIETGIDIPNTNTLIIDNADQLGLSQIYQIRGRVGRSNKIAYAYLTYKKNKVLTQTAAKRLNAIKEFTSLGSGYRIAIKDLAIRGAGDILGREQSGFIDSVGIDMYMRMLDEAINKIKGLKTKEKPYYDIEVSKHVDDKYVSDDTIKIYIHKEISKIESQKEKERIINEFIDRFGKLNEEILLYIEKKYLESLLIKNNINKINETNNMVIIILSSELLNKINIENLFMKAYEISSRFSFESKRKLLIMKIEKTQDEKNWIYLLTRFFEDLA
ncbi:MAG: transcription-repair coupling factor [Bacilli bacterium]|jgi:transcription-repair coupling factor (superfamily II helicase)